MLIEMQIKTVSTLNTREHFRVAAKRKALQRSQTRKYLSGLPTPQLPVIVCLTRYSSGSLDAHDNLPSAFKHVVDEIATWLGIDDADQRVQWRYEQEKCKRGQTWVTAEFLEVSA
jgi:hypothetical protein